MYKQNKQILNYVQMNNVCVFIERSFSVLHIYIYILIYKKVYSDFQSDWNDIILWNMF